MNENMKMSFEVMKSCPLVRDYKKNECYKENGHEYCNSKQVFAQVCNYPILDDTILFTLTVLFDLSCIIYFLKSRKIHPEQKEVNDNDEIELMDEEVIV